MKNKYLLLSIITIALAFTGICASSSNDIIPSNMKNTKEVGKQQPSKTKKILVAYFSHSGNTRIIAEYISKATGADIFEILPVKPYPTDYNTVVDQADKEIAENYKPELKTKVENIERYDVIFVGSPNWWSTIAPPVATFLTSYNLTGKTIVPFITHEGSAMGNSVADIKKLCPNSIVLEGLPVRGRKVKNSQNEVSEWLRKINIIN